MPRKPQAAPAVKPKLKAKTEKQASKKAPSKPAKPRSAAASGRPLAAPRSARLRTPIAKAGHAPRAGRSPAGPGRCERCHTLAPVRTLVQLYDDLVCPQCAVVWYAVAVVPGEEARVVKRIQARVTKLGLRSAVKAVKVHRHKVRVDRMPCWEVTSTRGDGTTLVRPVGAEDFDHILAKYRKFWPGETIQEYKLLKAARTVVASVKAHPGYVLVKMRYGPEASGAVEVDGALGLLPAKPPLGRIRYPRGEPAQRVKPTKKELEERTEWRPTPLGWDEDVQSFLDRLRQLTAAAEFQPPAPEPPTQETEPMKEEPKPQEPIAPGDRVRITDGILRNAVVTVCRATPEAVRVMAGMMIGGQRVESVVTVPVSSCEKVPG